MRSAGTEGVSIESKATVPTTKTLINISPMIGRKLGRGRFFGNAALRSVIIAIL